MTPEQELEALESLKLGMQLVLEMKARTDSPAIAFAALGIAIGALCEVLKPGCEFDASFHNHLGHLFRAGALEARNSIEIGQKIARA